MQEDGFVSEDTHGRQSWEIPNCDVFIHAGDMTGRGSLQETSAFASRLRKEMESSDGPTHAIIVPGNHDECFETLPRAARELFDANVHVLEDEPLVLEGVTFYGSLWTPPFMRESRMCHSSKRRICNKIPVLRNEGDKLRIECKVRSDVPSRHLPCIPRRCRTRPAKCLSRSEQKNYGQ